MEKSIKKKTCTYLPIGTVSPWQIDRKNKGAFLRAVEHCAAKMVNNLVGNSPCASAYYIPEGPVREIPLLFPARDSRDATRPRVTKEHTSSSSSYIRINNNNNQRPSPYFVVDGYSRANIVQTTRPGI